MNKDTTSRSGQNTVPKSETSGGWDVITSDNKHSQNPGVDYVKLDRLFELQDFYLEGKTGQPSSFAMVRLSMNMPHSWASQRAALMFGLVQNHLQEQRGVYCLRTVETVTLEGRIANRPRHACLPIPTRSYAL